MYLALAARGVSYPYRGAILGNLLVLHLGALGENVYALYRIGHARHLRDSISGGVGPAFVRGPDEVIYPDLSHNFLLLLRFHPNNKQDFTEGKSWRKGCPQIFRISEKTILLGYSVNTGKRKG